MNPISDPLNCSIESFDQKGERCWIFKCTRSGDIDNFGDVQLIEYAKKCDTSIESNFAKSCM